MRKRAIPFRRSYLRAVIDQVEVDDDEVRIHRRHDVLERPVMRGVATAAVPSFVRKYRAGRDSNLLSVSNANECLLSGLAPEKPPARSRGL